MIKQFTIKGMHCNSCAVKIQDELKDKVNSIKVSYANEKAEIDFDEKNISEKEIRESIRKLGYTSKDCKCEGCVNKTDICCGKCENSKCNNIINKEDAGTSDNIAWLISIIGIIAIGFLAYYLLGGLEIQIPNMGDNVSLLLLFGAGLLTGFHCIAMCGGFVVSYTAKNALQGHKSFTQHLVYGGSKVVSYTIIGGIFGLIGGIFAFSIGLRGWIAIIAGIFMIFYALGIFGIKFFRIFQFKFGFMSKLTSEVPSGAYLSPMIIGLLNGLFLACGPLQAMYLYAAGTSSFFQGASSLFAFGLGTLPVMLGFGFFATTISHKTTGKILKVSAIIVLVLGLIMLNRGLNLTGSNFSYEIIKTKITGTNLNVSNVVVSNGVQEINMNVDASGYSPNSFVLKQGVPVKWNINVLQLTGCNSELVANAYNIDIKLKQGLQTIEFTPDKTGTIQFTCGMGMLHGSFVVTSSGTATQQQIVSASPKASSSCGCGGM